MTENKVLPISYPRKSKINLYIEEMISKLNRIYPDLEEDKIKEIVIKKVKEDYAKKAPTVKVDDNIIPIHTMDKYILEENLLVTGSGSLYQQHEGSLNLNVEIIKFLKRERNKYKGLMFKAMEESKIALYERNDVNQKVFKLFNNSFYGVQTQENSIFFNPESGPSITQSGQDIITTSVITFERFLTGNIFMENINDAFIYVDNILNEKDPEIKINIKMIPTINIVLEWLLSKVDYYSIEDKEKLNRFLSTLTDKELLRVYYKNNLIKLIENSDIYENYISKFVVRDDFTDPNKPPKDLIKDINEYWSIVRDYVFYNYSDYYRFRNMFSSNERKRLRRAVLTIDTDSNFCVPRCA